VRWCQGHAERGSLDSETELIPPTPHKPLATQGAVPVPDTIITAVVVKSGLSFLVYLHAVRLPSSGT
jgi:hypothetical protein